MAKIDKIKEFIGFLKVVFNYRNSNNVFSYSVFEKRVSGTILKKGCQKLFSFL